MPSGSPPEPYTPHDPDLAACLAVLHSLPTFAVHTKVPLQAHVASRRLQVSPAGLLSPQNGRQASYPRPRSYVGRASSVHIGRRLQPELRAAAFARAEERRAGMQRGGRGPPERCTRDRLLHGHSQHAPPSRKKRSASAFQWPPTLLLHRLRLPLPLTAARSRRCHPHDAFGDHLMHDLNVRSLSARTRNA